MIFSQGHDRFNVPNVLEHMNYWCEHGDAFLRSMNGHLYKPNSSGELEKTVWYVDFHGISWNEY